MKNSTFNVTGMSCASCARTVENALNKNEDIKASVNIATEKVNIEYDENKYNFEKIKKNLHKIEIVQSSMEEYLDGTDLKINRFNLSDIFEYMSLGNYEKLMKKIYDKSANEAKLAYWNLVVERNAGLIKDRKEKRFERLERLDKELHKKDKTFFYTDFVVEKVIKNGNS